MKYLWAPWRMDYILGSRKRGCIFCLKTKRENDLRRLVVYRGKYAFVMMNRYPYNNGHLMIVPHRHCIDLESLSHLESEELFELLRLSIRVLKMTFAPQGFNIGVNIGKVGGAGEEHVHFHLVPRWAGDTNFMPILAETKVVPEHLTNTFQRLQSAFIGHLKKKKGRKGE